MRNKKILSVVVSILLLFSLIIPSYASEIKAGDTVLLGGIPFGVKFYSGNMTVSGFSEVDGEGGDSSPAYEAGLRENDVIIKINGNEVKSAEEVTRAVENSQGKTISFICKRNDKDITLNVTPIKSRSAGTYKIGIWIKDSTAGIGTITYVDPNTGEFGGLGHGIYKSETGELLKIRRGIINDVKISGVVKGEVGAPGELKGFFSSGKNGIVNKNTDCGVFGVLTKFKESKYLRQEIEIASRDKVKNGKASVFCTLSDNTLKEYTIEINCDKCENSKCFNITVTDPALLAETGGIVQGMSGSPIVQEGKLIGAVTHVLVNDPTKGYGIFIENMLNAAQIPMARAS